MDNEEKYKHFQKFFKTKYEENLRINSGFIQDSMKGFCTPDQASAQGIEHEFELDFQKDFLKEIELKKSLASCKISEIEGFTFGPFTSRFWVMRK